MSKQVVLVMVLGFVSSTALAQPAVANGSAREGFLAGISIGGGGMDLTCDEECDNESLGAATEFSLRLGAMVAPKFALMFEASGATGDRPIEPGADRGDVSVSQVSMLASAQVWILPKLWLRGGAGVAQMTIEVPEELADRDEGFTMVLESDYAPALAASAGYEVYQRGTFALDVAVRYGVGLHSFPADRGQELTVAAHQFGASVGLNWY